MRFGGGVFLHFFCFCSLLGVLLQDNDRDDIEKLWSARRIDDVDRRCILDEIFGFSADESLLLESLLEHVSSKFELCTFLDVITKRPDVDEHESVEELRESSSP